MSGTDDDVAGEEAWRDGELARSQRRSSKRLSMSTKAGDTDLASPGSPKAADGTGDVDTATRSALERLAISGQASQADEHRHAIAIHYPGYNPARPYPLPMQNNRQLRVRTVLDVVLRANEETLRRYGVRSQMQELCQGEEMRCFFRDAFWWLFLEHFADVDFDAMVQRAKKNVLVSDMDIQTFFYGTGLGNALPVPPHRKRILAERRRVKVTKDDFNCPAHVCMFSCRNRQLPEVALIGAPRSPSVASLASSVSVLDSDGSNSDAASPTRSRSHSVASSAASSSVDSVMRRSAFPLSHHNLHLLDVGVRDQIIATEQHQLFTRMSLNYKKLLVGLMPLHFSLKDAVSRMLPEIVAQGLYYTFARSLPFALHLLDAEFQAQVAQTVNYWLGGVQRHGEPRKWPIQHVIYPHLRKRHGKKSRKSEPGDASEDPKAKGGRVRRGVVLQNRAQQLREGVAHDVMMKPRPPGSGPSTARASLNRSSTTLAVGSTAASPRSARPAPSKPVASPAPGGLPALSPLSARHASQSAVASPLPPPAPQPKASTGLSPEPPQPPPQPQPDGGAGARRRLSLVSAQGDSGAATPGAAAASREHEEAEVEDPKVTARKKAMIKRELDSMKNDLRRMITTHTFAQAHYGSQGAKGATGPGGGGGGGGSGAHDAAGNPVAHLPKRIANTFALGPQKRTVQVIKAELDANYRDAVPWYNDPRRKIPVKEQLGAAKFSLSNWSPLLHRFMLLNGEENRAVPEAMSWTT